MPENKYSAIVEQELNNTESSSGSVYTDILDQEKNEFDSSVSNNMYEAFGQDPEKAARVKKVSSQLGVSPGAVERDFDGYSRKAKNQDIDYDNIIANAPVTAESLQNKETASIVSDDLLTLSNTEWLFSVVPEAYRQGQEQLESSYTGWNQILNIATPEELNRADQIDSEQGGWLGEDGWMQESVVEGSKILPSLVDTFKGSAKGALALGIPAAGVGLATGPGAIPLGITGATLGARGGAGYVSFQQIAGSSYRQYVNIKDVDGKPLDEDVARAAALGSGIIGAGLDVIGVSALAKVSGGDFLLDKLRGGAINELIQRKSVQTALKDLTVRYGEAHITEVATEMGQEVVNIFFKELAEEASGQEFGAEQDFDLGSSAEDIFNVGVQTAKAMTLIAAPGPGARFANDVRKARKANRDQQTIKGMGESAKASKTAKRSPETYQDFVKKVQDNGNVQDVYIPAEKLVEYFQDKEISIEEKFSDIAPEVSIQIPEAIATGGDIQIPLDVYMTHIATTEDHEGLSGDIRFNPVDWTENEALEILGSADARLMDQLKRSEVIADEKTDLDTQLDIIQKKVSDDLIKAGRTADIANAESMPIREFFRSIHSRTGKDPLALFESKGLGVIGPDVDQNVEFAQGLSDTDPRVTEAQTVYEQTITARDERAVDTDGAIPESQDSEIVSDAPAQNIESAGVGDQNKISSESVQDSGVVEDSENSAATAGVQEIDPDSQEAVEAAETLWEAFGTRSPFFQEWFGDGYFKDADGNPRVIYHGTGNPNKKEFLASRLGGSTGAPSSGSGFHLSSDEAFASIFGENMIKGYVNIQNPKILTKDEHDSVSTVEEAKQRTDDLIAEGYDGIYIPAVEGDRDIIVAFDSGQIKSIENRGTFDPSRANIFEQNINDLPRGKIMFNEDRSKTLIQLLDNANLSTFLHESGHFFLDTFSEIAADTDNPQIQSDLQALLDWFGIDDMSKAGTREHEMFAEGMETYFFEGKAPSLELESSFARFRAWMTSIYKRLKSMRIQLTPEVRGVMDRMLATDEQIAEAEQLGSFEALWRSAEEAGITEKEFENYVAKSQAATDDSRAKLFEKTLKEITRTRTKWWKEEKAKISQEVTDNVNERPVWQALDFLRTGSVVGREIPEAIKGMKLSKDILIETYGKDFLKSLPKPFIYQADGGLDPDDVADMFGFDSGDQMISSMKKATRPEIGVSPTDSDIPTEADIEDSELARDVREIYKRVKEVDFNDPKSLKGVLGYTPVPLHKFIKDNGGIYEPLGELKARDITSKSLPGLIRKTDDTINGADVWGQRLVDSNYIRTATTDSGPLTPDEVYDAITSSIKEGNIYDIETNDKLASLTRDFDVLDDLERAGVTEETTDADIAAVVRGDTDFVSSVREASVIAKQRSKSDVIADETNQIMFTTFGDMLNDGSLAEEAMLAVMNDERGDVIASELKIIEGLTKDARKQSARRDRSAGAQVKEVQSKIDAKFARKTAKRVISKKRLRDIKPDKYQAAALRNSRKAEEAVARRDFDVAGDFKRKQLISHYMYIEGRNAKRDSDKMVKYFKKFEKKAVRQKIGFDYMQQIDQLLEQFEFKKVSLKSVDRRKAFNKWVDEKTALGEIIVVNDAIKNINQKTNYVDLDMETLLGLNDTVRNIEHLGRLKNKLISSKNKRDFDATVDGMTDVIYSENKVLPESDNISPDLKERSFKSLKSGHAVLTKMEFLFNKLDGFKPNGIVWKSMFKPIADAENNAKKLMEPLTVELNGIFNTYSRQDRAGLVSKRIFVPEVSKNFTRSEMLMVALNWGNEGNRKALMDGYGWNPQQVNAILDHLTEQDWKAAQAILDLINSLWPKISALQKELTGIIPEKVESSTIQTKFGEFKGGYFPLVGDADKSFTTFLQNQKDSNIGEGSILFQSYISPATQQGHTIERLGWGKKPLKLELSVITDHMNNVVHDITHRKAIYDVYKIAKDERFRAAVEQTAGPDMYRQITPWLQAIAKDQSTPVNYWEKIISRARVGTTIVNMGWKITTAVVQPLGYLNAIDVLGSKYAAIGLKEFYSANPIKMNEKIQEVFNKSEMMKNRQKTFDRDVRDTVRKLQGVEELTKLKQSFFMLTGLADMGTSMPTWIGAYQKGLDELFDGNEQEAVDYADSIVRKTQSSGSVKDLAAIQRGGELQRMFTMFYSYFSALYNLFSERGAQVRKGDLSVPQFAASMFFLWFIPSTLSEVVAGRFPDDEDEWAEFSAKQLGLYPFQTVVGMRDIANSVGGDFGFKLSPLENAFLSIPKAVGAAGDVIETGDLTDKELRAFLDVVGYWGHLPTKQMWITGDALYNFAQSDDVDMRDFFFPKKQ